MSARVTVRERGETDGCPFCRDTLLEDDEVLRCGTCETRLHAACFRENGLACTVLGCGGRAVVPVAGSPSPPSDEVPWESKRARKRRLRAQHRAEQRARARQRERPGPIHARPAAAPVEGETAWFQGPIGLGAILTLLFVVPPLVGEMADVIGGPPAAALALLAFCGGLAWIVYVGAFGRSR